MDLYHWAFFTGPAEMVRQGGSLLWDVPSQYGFLSTLLLAWLPIPNVWISLYIAGATAIFTVAVVAYFALSTVSPTWQMRMTALFVTLSGTLLIPSYLPGLLGPQTFPGNGGFRFGWVYAILAVAIWADRKPHRARDSLRAGYLLWVIGSLWSFESFAWCSVTWLPTSALLSARRTGSAFTKTLIQTLVTTTFVAAGAFVAFMGAYTLVCGHLPDLYAYIEYARSYREGFFALPIDPHGTVWALSAVFALLAWTTLRIFVAQGLAAVPATLLATTGLLWSTSSYFVSRSHENNATSLTPALVVGAAALLHLCARQQLNPTLRRAIPAALVPLFGIILILGLHDIPMLNTYRTVMYRGFRQMRHNAMFPVDPALQDIFSRAPIFCEDAVSAVMSPGVLPTLCCQPRSGGPLESATTFQIFLPSYPSDLLVPLEEKRRRVYVERFLRRTNAKQGWLIEQRNYPDRFGTWIVSYVEDNFEIIKTVENELWRARLVRPVM